jgi:hypothetical protein
MGNPHKADAHFLCKIFFKKLLTNSGGRGIMAGRGLALAAGPRRKFNYTTRRQKSQVKFSKILHKYLSHNLVIITYCFFKNLLL